MNLSTITSTAYSTITAVGVGIGVARGTTPSPTVFGFSIAASAVTDGARFQVLGANSGKDGVSAYSPVREIEIVADGVYVIPIEPQDGPNAGQTYGLYRVDCIDFTDGSYDVTTDVCIGPERADTF